MYTINRVYFVLFIGVLKDVQLVCCGIKCDATKSTNLHAGELGLHAAFPWLGLLRVHLYESKKTALSGVVLVRDRYAIGNAEDIARIPRRIFRRDTDVLFIPSTGETWVCRLLDFLTHPEYDNHISTIALVELDLVGKVPLSAVCWPQITTDPYELYAIGYSDALDNNIEFGKMILKIKHENKTACDAFYDNVGLTANGFQLEQFLCAFAVDPTEDCIWETGMAMVSNATGVWTLIGLSVQGPACEKPARFLEFFLYLDWIQSVIDSKILDSYRRSGHGLDFKNIKKKEKQDIFIHETFLSYLKTGRRKGDTKVDAEVLDDLGLSIFPYPFRDPDSHFNFKVDRIDRDAINISVFSNTYEVEGACHRFNYMIYQDRTKVVAKEEAGTVAYRLTLYDMLLNNLTCVQVNAKSRTRTPATLWWMTYIDKGEGTAFGLHPETPEALLKIFQHPSAKRPIKGDGRWIPKDHLEPRNIEDPNDTLNIMNVNLLVKLAFVHEAQLNVKVYGMPGTPPTTTTSTTPATSTEIPEVNTSESKVNFEHEDVFNDLNLPRRREYSQVDHQYIWETPETSTHLFNNYNVLQRGHVERDQGSEQEGDPKQQSNTFNDLRYAKPLLLHRNTEKYRHYKEENKPKFRLSGSRIKLWPESYREKDQDNVGNEQKSHKHKHQFNPFNDPHYSNKSLRHWSTEKDHYSKWGDYRPEFRLPKHQFKTKSEKDNDYKEGNKNEKRKPKHKFKTFNDPHHSNITLRHWSAEEDRLYRPREINEKEKPPHHSLIWPRGSIQGKLTPKINNLQRQNPKEADIIQNDQGFNYSKHSYGRPLHNRRRQDLDGITHQKPALGQNVGRGHRDVESLTQQPQRVYKIKKNEGSKGNPQILRLEDY